MGARHEEQEGQHGELCEASVGLERGIREEQQYTVHRFPQFLHSTHTVAKHIEAHIF